MFPKFSFILSVWLAVAVSRSESVVQIPVATTERMPALPSPLAVRPWEAVAQAYYQVVFDPQQNGEGFPAVTLESDGRFRMKSYLGSTYDTEAFTCLAAVAGAKLSGLDPTNLHGVNFLSKVKAWYDPETGLFRHRAGERGADVSADIYGYWPAILGLQIADLYPEDAELKQAAETTFQAFHQIARGLGAPESPDFGGLGWNFGTHAAGGRDEPMNRLGHAPSVAWVLMAGGAQTGNREMLTSSRAAMQWYIDHPGRYEVSHMMGPLTAARLNTMGLKKLDLGRVLDAWFGDGPPDRCPWRITAGTNCGGRTCDGLDAARAGDGFYAFSMGSLQGPAWLVPLVRYDPRYARAIGRYALHAANSCRLLQGEGLPVENQDHAAWKAKWDPENLFFYEGLRSSDPTPKSSLGPYATGDPVSNGWAGKPKVSPENYLAEKEEWFGKVPSNIALYMGNHVGFLAGIVEKTNIPGILSWDCVKTDWFRPATFPTRLVFNPYPDSKTIQFDLGPKPVDVYDLVSRKFVLNHGLGKKDLVLPGDTAAILVLIPTLATKPSNNDQQFVSGQTVIDWNHPGPMPTR